jgi:hypothetical protein
MTMHDADPGRSLASTRASCRLPRLRETVDSRTEFASLRHID